MEASGSGRPWVEDRLVHGSTAPEGGQCRSASTLNSRQALQAAGSALRVAFDHHVGGQFECLALTQGQRGQSPLGLSHELLSA